MTCSCLGCSANGDSHPGQYWPGQFLKPLHINNLWFYLFCQSRLSSCFVPAVDNILCMHKMITTRYSGFRFDHPRPIPPRCQRKILYRPWSQSPDGGELANVTTRHLNNGGMLPKNARVRNPGCVRPNVPTRVGSCISSMSVGEVNGGVRDVVNGDRHQGQFGTFSRENIPLVLGRVPAGLRQLTLGCRRPPYSSANSSSQACSSSPESSTASSAAACGCFDLFFACRRTSASH